MKILMHLLSTQIFDIDEKQLCRITGAATWEKKNARPDFPRVLVSQPRSTEQFAIFAFAPLFSLT